MSPLLPCEDVGSEEEIVMFGTLTNPAIWLGVMNSVSLTGSFSVPATLAFWLNVSMSL